MAKASILSKTFDRFLSEGVKERSERIILWIAIVSYLLHLAMIVLVQQGFIELDSKFFSSPIAAIYTPFSFILVYEVYLLIFFLPQSITVYIGKQYEIITLIVIRRIFKDIANIKLTSNWFQNQDDLQFTYDVVTAVLLFFLIFLFFKNIIQSSSKKRKKSAKRKARIERFVHLKKAIAVVLVPILIILAFYTISDWIYDVVRDYQNGITAFKNINNIFFDEFFTILIIVDVLLLLASFFYSDKFHKIIRNSGFVISTILIKVSFSVEGIVNNALIIGAVLFGLLMLLIHNRYEKMEDVNKIEASELK
ncbi:MAG: hypothetical protein AAF433_12130 [Bacteroidota bacterium]